MTIADANTGWSRKMNQHINLYTTVWRHDDVHGVINVWRNEIAPSLPFKIIFIKIKLFQNQQKGTFSI